MLAYYIAAGNIEATYRQERLGVPLTEGKKIVHLSTAWADVRSENDSFHEALDEAASSGH